MPPSAREYLSHIHDEIRYIHTAIQGLDKEGFLHDETLKRALVRSIEIIGEAVKQLPESFRQQEPGIEWRAIAGMRDRLIHSYFGVDYEIVWDVVVNKIPLLEQAVLRLLQAQDRAS